MQSPPHKIVENTGISKKSARGWDDKSVSISLVILPNDFGDKDYFVLYEIEELFTRTEKGKPVTYEISHDHITNRGITKLLFTDFSSSEDNANNTIKVDLQFVEFIPATWSNSNKENPAGGSGKDGKDGKDGENSKDKKEDSLMDKVNNQYNKGFKLAGGK